MASDLRFDSPEREAIRAAVEAAEAGTSAEVVPYVVERCDDYAGAAWVAAVGGAVLAAIGAGMVHDIGGFWGGSGILWISLPVVVAAALAYGLASMSVAVRRWLVPREVLERRVRQRAELAFLEEEVFATRDRTGVLVFVALLERRAVVLGDEGIHAAVAPEEWEEVVADICRRLREGRPTEALVGAVEACGRLLHERRLERRTDDADELSNELRFPRD